MKFELSPSQEKKYKSWMKKQKIIYTGAIGVGASFIFTPTSIGCIVEVKYNNKVLSLTEDF